MISERFSFSSKDKMIAVTVAPVILFLVKTSVESVTHTLSSRRKSQNEREVKKRRDLEFPENSQNFGDYGIIFSNPSS